MIEGVKSLLAKLIPSPINQFNDGTIAISSRMYKQISLGNGYTASERIENLDTTYSVTVDLWTTFI